MHSTFSSTEYLELKTLLLEQRAILKTLFPDKVSLSLIKERIGLTRQAIRMNILPQIVKTTIYKI